MNYIRVIPRDFFNESKLLKCMGQLSLKILDCQLPKGIEMYIEGDGQPFQIGLSNFRSGFSHTTKITNLVLLYLQRRLPRSGSSPTWQVGEFQNEASYVHTTGSVNGYIHEVPRSISANHIQMALAQLHYYFLYPR